MHACGREKTTVNDVNCSIIGTLQSPFRQPTYRHLQRYCWKFQVSIRKWLVCLIPCIKVVLHDGQGSVVLPHIGFLKTLMVTLTRCTLHWLCFSTYAPYTILESMFECKYAYITEKNIPRNDHSLKPNPPPGPSPHRTSASQKSSRRA